MKKKRSYLREEGYITKKEIDEKAAEILEKMKRGGKRYVY